VIFSVLNILVLSLLAYELAGRRKGAAYLTALLLALSPMHVFRLALSGRRERRGLLRGHGDLLPPALLQGAGGGHGCARLPRPVRRSMGGALLHAHRRLHLGPLLLLAMAAAAFTARTRREFIEIAAYGTAVFGGFALSVWYGMNWSFPYSYDIYRALFGETVGKATVRGWPWMLLAAGAPCAIVVAAAWLLRAPALRLSRSEGVRTASRGLVAAAVVAIVAFTFVDAIRVGFTPAYLEDPFAAQYSLGGSGLRGFTHATGVVLAIYVSPFLFAFFLSPPSPRGGGASRCTRRLLLVVIAQYLVVRVIAMTVTPYYYYGRYLATELIPFVTVLAAVWLNELWRRDSRLGRALAALVVALSLAWGIVAVARQHLGGEMHRLDASYAPWIGQIDREHSVILLAGGQYPAMRTTLGYYYGVPTAVVDLKDLRETVRAYLRTWANVYLLSDLDSLSAGSYMAR
jgi:hypothetical protein